MRARTIAEALDLAVEVMTEAGVGGLTMSELARRMGMRGPSLYKYFASLHDLYDLLFARGQAAVAQAVADATAGMAPGLDTIRAGCKAIVGWCVQNPALAQLLYWRVVPGFEPVAGTFAASHDQMTALRRIFAETVRSGQLSPSADSDTAVRLLTVVISGLITQQMANQPDVSYEEGLFTTLTDESLDMFFDHYLPTRKGRS